MTWLTPLQSSFSAVGIILAAMVVVALIEIAIPLHARGRWNAVHLGPNLALTSITFATNLFFNAALVLVLSSVQFTHFGLLHRLGLSPLLSVAAAILMLDFSFYVAHVAMHKIPGFWRYHRVHHSDPAVDVTTTIRQHPGESGIRYAFLAAFAIPLGVSPAGFAVYRIWSVLNGLLEHANVRLPARLDDALSLITTWPNMHKIHHSRDPRYTDTNYGNIVSLWDRLFSTFTPARYGADVSYGLDGLDGATSQTTYGLLAMPLDAFELRRHGMRRGATT